MFLNGGTIASIDPSGLFGQVKQGISLIFSYKISAFVLSKSRRPETYSSLVFARICGIAPCMVRVKKPEQETRSLTNSLKRKDQNHGVLGLAVIMSRIKKYSPPFIVRRSNLST